MCFITLKFEREAHLVSKWSKRCRPKVTDCVYSIAQERWEQPGRAGSVGRLCPGRALPALPAVAAGERPLRALSGCAASARRLRWALAGPGYQPWQVPLGIQQCESPGASLGQWEAPLWEYPQSQLCCHRCSLRVLPKEPLPYLSIKSLELCHNSTIDRVPNITFLMKFRILLL